MQDDSRDAKPDASSIRPVSSLLSHFENISTPAAAPQPILTQQPNLQSKVLQSKSQDTSDIESTIIEKFPVQPALEALRNENPRPSSPRQKKRPPSPPKSRPLAHQSRSPPRVNVSSPKSPPKTLVLPKTRSFDPGPLTPTIAKSSAPNTPPPRRFRVPNRPNGSADEPQESATLQALDLSDVAFKTNTQLGSSSTARPPPPVNRSAKPRISSKELGLQQDSKSSGLSIKAPERKVSPFNTPPSSGNNSPVEGAPPPLPLSSKPIVIGEDKSVVPAFEPPPTHHVVAARRRGNTSNAAARPRIPSRGIDSSASSAAGDTDTAPDRPPRRIERSRVKTDIGQSSTATISSKPSALSQGFARSAPISTNANALQTREQRTPTPPARQSGEWARPTKSVQTSSSLQMQEHVDSSPAPIPYSVSPEDYPDSSQANRRFPSYREGPKHISNVYDTRLFDVCSEYVCTSGTVTRVWNLLTGKLLLNMPHAENLRISSLSFKPARKLEDEGTRLWLGTNWGEIHEVDVAAKKIVATNSSIHSRRDVIKIYRQATELWTLDDEGKLAVWPSDDQGTPQLGLAIPNPRLPRGHTTSIVVGNQLWHATGNELRVFEPTQTPDTPIIHVTQQSISQAVSSDMVSSAFIPSQPDRVYFGHSDGKITVYSRKDYSCIDVITISMYKITSLVGVANYLWAGNNTGKIFVYDTSTRPWKVKKVWQGHTQPVCGMIADRSSIWRLDRLQVISLGIDNTIGIWDGMLRIDWLEDEMQSNTAEFCKFREASALVVTWNAGASKPSDLRYDERDSNFFRELFEKQEPPDIVVFGLQELVDLEDKRLTAKSFFKGKNKDVYGHEHLSSVYRAWRDELGRAIEEHMPTDEHYVLLHTASLVGLFTCVFVRAPLKAAIRDVQAAEVKTGMGGLYGNKGALIVRFLIDDTSLCFVNCHLAAGQNQAMNRHQDVATILDTSPLPPARIFSSQAEALVGGGDGTSILDHEICVLNGDLNYRLDSISRDAVVSAIRASNYAKLLERDQLLVARRRNPTFHLCAFAEAPLTFAPTYKYDVGSDSYDSSEKRRVPAWCDRLLVRGPGKIAQLSYERHEVRVSDHRPVSGRFRLVLKAIVPERKQQVWERSKQRFEQVKARVSADAKLHYLTSVFGVSHAEAQQRLLDG